MQRSQAQIAEEFAVNEFGMEMAETNQAGYDGILPDGKKLQVKSKKWGSHPLSGTYVDLAETVVKGSDAADLLLVVFVDEETKEIKDYIGPTSIEKVIKVAQRRVTYRVTMNKL